MTRYEKDRTGIWVLQVRSTKPQANAKHWSVTGAHWFYTRKEVKQYIATKIAKINFEYYEYRPMRYMPYPPQTT